MTSAEKPSRPGRRPPGVMALWVASVALFILLWVRSPVFGVTGMLTWWSLATLPLFVWERALRRRDADEGTPRHTVTVAIVLFGGALIALSAFDVHAHMRLDGYYTRRVWLEALGRGLAWTYVVFPVSVAAGMLLASTGALPDAGVETRRTGKAA